jgi:hypothetical protein
MPDCQRGGPTVIQNDVSTAFVVAMASNGYLSADVVLQQRWCPL